MNQQTDGADYCTRVVSDLAAIGEAKWNALVAASGGGNPFVRYEFLHALHSSGCAAPRSGWEMQYLTLWRGDELVGAVPLYRKHHSYGEYVFDWAWASAYQQHGIEYYPKWLSAVPFTPVPGTRLIVRDSQKRSVWNVTRVAARDSGLSRCKSCCARPAKSSPGGPGMRTRVRCSSWFNRILIVSRLSSYLAQPSV